MAFKKKESVETTKVVEVPDFIEVPVVVFANVVVYDTLDGNKMKIVTKKEARSERYKPV